MNRLLIPIIMLICAIIYLAIYFLINTIITRKRLKISQNEWNEYSKNMTDEQKWDVFLDFLNIQKEKHGWLDIYIPCWFAKTESEVRNDEK